MGSIYESQGQQIQLTGPTVQGGFNPGQAYDPSRMMLQRSESDLKSFAGFSETLNKYLQDTAKQKAEEEYKLGIAEVINGDVNPSEQDQAEFKANRDGLQAQAKKDDMVADQMEQESVPLANQKRVSSPAKNGWRAYGNAVGYVKKASSSAYAVLGEMMTSDTPIQLTQLDGTVTSIIPSQIKDPGTWNVAWRYNLQQYLAKSGVSGINPMIISEELTPTIGQVKSQLFATRMAAARKELQAEAIESNNVSIVQGLSDLTYKEGGYTSQDLANFWQEQSAAMNTGTGIQSRGEANAAVIKRIAGTLLASGQDELLDQFKNVPLLADQPNGIKLGEYYSEEFFAASQGIIARNDALEARQTKEDQQAVDDILDERTRGLINTPADAAAITAATREQLTRLNNSPGGNKAALKAILALDSADNSYSPVNYPRLLQQFRANPDSYSSAAAKDLYTAGNINAEEYAKLEKQFGSSNQSEKTKKFQSNWQKQAAAVIQRINANKGVINESSNSFGTAIIVATSEVNDKINQFLRTKPNATDQEIAEVAQRYFENMAQDNRFIFEPDSKTGQLVLVNSFTKGNFVVPYYKPDGTNKLSRDFTKISDPAILKQSNPMPTVDRILTPQELQAAKERLGSGQQPTARVLSQMQATGLSTEQLVRAQSRAYGLPTSDLDSSKATKASRERLLYAPAAAAILANPNASSIQRIRAWGDIADAKQRAQRRAAEGKALGAGPDLMPGARVSMNDYVRLGIQNGLSPDEAVRFAAVGMAESTGQSGVVGKEFPVYGLWQINMAGAMGPDRMRRYGFRSAEELKDPETNARVAVALYKDKGINDWSAYTDGRYRQYLADAKRAYYELKRAGFASKANGNAGSQAILLGRQLLGQGYKIWQHPNFDLNKGYVSGGARVWQRPYDSAHNHGEALDFPLAGATGGNNTPEQLDQLAAMLNANKERFGIKTVLWRTKGHQDHLHVDFKDS
jgi:hypothetical protein